MERVPSHACTKIFLLCEPRTVTWFACLGGNRSIAGFVAAHFERTVRAYSEALDQVPTDAWLFALFSFGPSAPLAPLGALGPLRYLLQTEQTAPTATAPSAVSEQTIVASLYPEHFGAELCPGPYETHDRAILAAARYQLTAFAYKWRVRDLRDIAAYRPTDPFDATYDPACPSFRARVVRSPFSLPRKYDAHMACSASRALCSMRAHDQTLSATHRAFLDGTAQYSRVPENAIRYILRKRELKPNYARQFGPVEVWDVRDVPLRYHRDGDMVLHGTTFSCREHGQCHDTSFWSVRPAKRAFL
jgi:hypothetical protein